MRSKNIWKEEMNIKEVETKSIVSKSNLPEADYVVNPYIGCAHGCVYCYSRFMIRFTGHKGERWGSFVDIKVNAPKLIERDLNKVKSNETIVLSSVTDSYQPLERKYRITRKILAAVAKLCWRYSKIPLTIGQEFKRMLND